MSSERGAMKTAGQPFEVKPYGTLAWSMRCDLWATCEGDQIIDVYADRDMAEAWVKYMNARRAAR